MNCIAMNYIAILLNQCANVILAVNGFRLMSQTQALEGGLRQPEKKLTTL